MTKQTKTSLLFLLLLASIFLVSVGGQVIADEGDDDDGGCGDEPNCEDVVVEETKSDKKEFDESDDDFKNKNTDLPEDYVIPGPPVTDPPKGEPKPEDDDSEDDPCAEAKAKAEEAREKVTETKSKWMDFARESYASVIKDFDCTKFNSLYLMNDYYPDGFQEETNQGWGGNPDATRIVSAYNVAMESVFRELSVALMAVAKECGGDGFTPLRDDQKE